MARITTAALALLLLAVGVAAGAGRPASDTGRHLFVVPTDDAPALALAQTDARLIARYEAFTLVEASGDDSDRLLRAGADLRDDMREVTVGERSFDPTRGRRSLARKRGAPTEPGLAVVQFVGPIKDAWLARLRKTGVRVVIYMAQNGYLVHGSARELKRAANLLGEDPAVRAVVPYTAGDKVRAGVKPGGKQRLAVQTLSGSDGTPARADVKNAGSRLRGTSAVGSFRTQHVLADAAEADELARDPGVVAITPSPAPELFDEAQDQILAGNTTGTDPLLPSGPGYLAFVDGLIGTATFPFSVDVTDEGIDAGVVGTTHPDLQLGGGGATRLDYVDNFTLDANAMDCGGHGTINAGIVGGFNSGTGATFEDVNGFNYGLGIAPRTKLGGSKIFRCSGAFSLTSTFTALTTNAYNKGARISSNSWGCGGCAGTYNADSQEYDALVRDAVPGTAGNQEMVEVFAAGNDGSGGNTIGTPGNGKNMITVGASENVRASGTDGCGVSNTGADDAHDIINFSSRGPAPGGRIKPDIVGPGTHIVGTKPQHGSYTGGGVCTGTFPAGSPLYSLSSGTSHSTPALSGVAALVRQWYTSGPGSGTPPSPALTKALIAQSGTDLVGGNNGAGGTNANVPNQIQGWGLANIQRALDTVTPRVHRDQQDVFGSTGQTFTYTFAVQDTSKPVRATLAFTDAPGAQGSNPVVNDVNLTVATGTGTFKGNVFSSGLSAAGGTSDPVNTLESVYLPAGTSGNFAIEVSAANIAGNGLPGNADTTDQDFALTVSNAAAVTAPVLAQVSSSTPEQNGDGDGSIEPGEGFGVSDTIKNFGNAGATGINGTLTGPASVTITDGTALWPSLSAGASGANSDALAGTLAAGAECGAPVQLSLAITSTEGAGTTVPVVFGTGGLGAPVIRNSTDVPKSIPDNNPAGVTSTLNVPEAGVVKDVNVRIVSLTHTWVGDLKIDITGPDATTVTLANRPGGENNSGDNFTNTVFDDEAAAPIGTGAPYTGSFRPQSDQLSRLDGKQQQGTWTLRVADLFAADIGTLNNWGHDIRPALCDFSGPPPPGAITGLTATGQPEAVALQWDDASGATSYKVYRKAGGVYPGTPTATPSASEFTDTGRTTGVEDCYKVQATNASGDGPMSGEVCATPTAAPPGAITGLTATGQVEAVALQWDDASGATGYKVYRKAGGVYPGTPTATPSASEFTDTGRTTGVEDCYKVQATNASGDGPMSGEVCATPTAPPAPGGIAGLTATGQVEAVALQWDDTPTATGYKVFRRNPDGVTYPSTPTATPTLSEYLDTGRTPGTQYCYKVQATNASGDGPMSGEICATATGNPPGAIAGLVSTAGVESVAIDWADTPTASDYYVYRRNPDGMSYPVLPTATVGASQYTDSGRPAGVLQCYKVEAHNTWGTGPASGETCATPQAVAGGGGTGTGPGGGTPEIPLPQKLDLSGLPGTVKVSAKGTFKLSFSSTANGTLTLTTVKAFAAAKKRKQTLASKSYTAPASGAVKLKLKLRKKHFKLLKRVKTLKVSAAAVSGELKTKRTLKLKAPKKKRKR